MNHLGYFGPTERADLTGDAGFYTPSKQFAKLIVTSDRKAHLKIVKSDDDAATTDDFQVQADTVYTIDFQDDDLLSYVAADGEPDGNIWIAITS